MIVQTRKNACSHPSCGGSLVREREWTRRAQYYSFCILCGRSPDRPVMLADETTLQEPPHYRPTRQARTTQAELAEQGRRLNDMEMVVLRLVERNLEVTHADVFDLTDMSHGRVKSTLDRLKRDGLIAAVSGGGKDKSGRKIPYVYGLTDQGRECLMGVAA